MQGQRSTIESVPEDVDINLGPSTLTDSMIQQTYLSSRLNQEGIHSSSHTSSSESSSSFRAVGNGDESIHARIFGQPSFMTNWENRPNFDGMKVEQDWYPSVGASIGVGPSLEARQSELHHNVLFPETVVTRNPNANLIHHGASIDRFLNLESEDGTSTVAQFGNSLHLSGSSTQMDGRTEGCGTSLAAWNSLSGKRKALEGTSGQSNPSTSSSGVLQAENFAWPNGTPPYGSSPDIMNLSPSTSGDSYSANFLEHLTPSTVLNVREAAIEPFPPLSITMGMGTAAAARSFDRRGSLRPQQEPYPFLSSTVSSLGSSRHPSEYSLSHRPGSSSNFLDTRSRRGTLVNAGVSQASLSNTTQAPQLPRNAPEFPWMGVQHSRNDNFTSSFLLGGSRDEANSRSMWRYISETPVVSSAAETRNMGQDLPSWDLAAGFTGLRQSSLPSSHQMSQISTNHPSLPPFITPRPMSPEMRWLLELVPRAPESFDAQNSHLPVPPSSSGSSSSPLQSGGNMLGRHQQHHRPGLSADRQSDELAMSQSTLRAFAGDIEGRSHVIAEVCVLFFQCYLL